MQTTTTAAPQTYKPTEEEVQAARQREQERFAQVRVEYLDSRCLELSVLLAASQAENERLRARLAEHESPEESK